MRHRTPKVYAPSGGWAGSADGNLDLPPRGSYDDEMTASSDGTDGAAPAGAPLRLDQLLKRENLVKSGGEAKQVIQGGLVRVNGQVETRRKKKLAAGDVVRFEGREVVVTLG